MMRIAELAAERQAGFAKTLNGINAADVGASAARAIHQFLEMLKAARTRLEDAEQKTATLPPRAETITPLAEWARELFDEIGLIDAIHADPRNDKTAHNRADNIRDLVGTIIRYERRVWNERGDGSEWHPPTLLDALAALALDDMDDEDEEPRTDEYRVTLMTLHSAKGLEFKDVYIVGLEEGILPHSRSIDDNTLDEERRLMYVGITRARERLMLSCCRSRKRQGGAIETLPSRFITEIPAELLSVKSASEPLPPEESEALRRDFMSNMRAMLE